MCFCAKPYTNSFRGTPLYIRTVQQFVAVRALHLGQSKYTEYARSQVGCQACPTCERAYSGTRLHLGKTFKIDRSFFCFQIKMVSAYILYPFNLMENKLFLIAISMKYE
jgi:hypothetical protein